jgi:hypothetical protein
VQTLQAGRFSNTRRPLNGHRQAEAGHDGHVASGRKAWLMIAMFVKPCGNCMPALVADIMAIGAGRQRPWRRYDGMARVSRSFRRGRPGGAESRLPGTLLCLGAVAAIGFLAWIIGLRVQVGAINEKTQSRSVEHPSAWSPPCRPSN